MKIKKLLAYDFLLNKPVKYLAYLRLVVFSINLLSSSA